MGKRRPTRSLQVSRWSEPPGYTSGRGRLPHHGKPTRHHMVPRSRGGQTVDSNLIEIPDLLHRAWHYLFTNMVPEEVIVHIAARLAPFGYFDALIMRQGDRQITFRRKDLERLADAPIDLAGLPNFRSERSSVVKAAYRHRKKRRRPKHK